MIPSPRLTVCAYRPWLMGLGLTLLATLLNGCTPYPINPMNSVVTQPNPTAPITQGLYGQVTRLSGNHMPGNAPTSTSGGTEAVQTTVWIFAGRLAGHGSATWPVVDAAQHPGLMRQVESDPSGHYSVALPPGEYTVLAQYGDDLYLNLFQGDGSYKSVR